SRQGTALRAPQARPAAPRPRTRCGDHRRGLSCSRRRWRIQRPERVAQPLSRPAGRRARAGAPGAFPPGARVRARRHPEIPEIDGEIRMNYRMQNAIALLAIAAVILLNAAL